jgi:hypothetical protein
MRKVSPKAALDADLGFASVVSAFARYRDVTRGGKGFGSTGLKVNGKLFALISSKGKFVAKLPKRRVDALVSAGKAEYFDPGHGRLMKEWAAVDPGDASWVDLAKEAHRFVKGAAG